MILRAKNIVKSYQGNPVLKGISLDVSLGESIAICGRSGEGKTTLLHILGTLEEPDSGELEINGQKFQKSLAPRLRNTEIGFIFQSYNLLEDFTVLENVLMPASIARRFETKDKGLELLSLVQLEHKAAVLAKFLSGGERQRVAIARALCNNPNLILADEPTGNLDRENRKSIGKLLTEIKKTLILVTHDAELAALCNKQYLLQDGRLKSLL